jgi:serine/threonine-protein phosphatase PP1 catalytic subunit
MYRRPLCIAKREREKEKIKKLLGDGVFIYKLHADNGSFFFSLFFFFFLLYTMGNISSKRKDRPSIIRPEVLDNEYSAGTTSSINPILASHIDITPSKQPKDYAFPNSLPDSPTNEMTMASLNQMSLPSQNQLSTHSTRSFGKNLDIDECISRLLDVANGKMSRSICFKDSEIIAICKAATEVFMSQPVKYM